MPVAEARGHVAGGEVVAGLIGEERGGRVEHADVDVLPAAGPLAREQAPAVTPCAANMPATMSAIATPSR